jgi:hypothetical protein
MNFQQKISRRAISFAFLSLCCAGPFMVVWLSAHQFISISAEGWTTLLGVAGIFAVHIYHYATRIFSVRLSIIFALIALLIIALARGASNRMFGYWTIKKISRTSWQQMESDILEACAKKAGENEIALLRHDIPKSFNLLGRKDEFSSSYITKLPEGDLGMYVAYGGSPRRWGLAIGSEMHLDSFFSGPRWRPFQKVRVTTNCVFFIGSDR